MPSSQLNDYSQDSHMIPLLLSRIKSSTASDLVRNKAIAKKYALLVKKSNIAVQ